MRPVLRPGLRLLRRDARTWQLGLDWPGVVALADDAPTAAVVAAMDGFHDREGVIYSAQAHGYPRAACEAALDRLAACGALQDADIQRPHDIPESTWSAWSLLAGPHGTAAAVAEARTQQRVAVQGTGVLADEVARVLGRVGVTVTANVREADLVVLANDREPSRAVSDEVMHSGVPHLWASLRDIVGLVGPFVEPGTTPCLRCVDASRSDYDPAWPTLLEASDARSLDTAPADPVIAGLVAAWAVHEVAAWASGIRPQTMGHVVEFPYGFGPVAVIGFELHPSCGCGWPTWQDTMGA